MRKAEKSILILLFLACLLLSGCAQARPAGLGLNTDLYANALAGPEQEVELEQINPAAALDSYLAVEAFDWQIEALLDHQPGLVWQPHYLASLVLVTDLEQTDRLATSFAELTRAGLPVALAGSQTSFRALYCCISYILDQDFSLAGASSFLKELHEQGLLLESGQPAAYRIMFDYEAAALIKSGHQLAMNIPREGTLTLQKGLLSRSADDLPAGSGADFLSAGLRLLDGQADPDIYPSPAGYRAAHTLANYREFNQASLEVWRSYRRQVLQIRRFSTADMREHILSALCFIALAIAWAAHMARRALNKVIRSLIYLIVVCLLGWTVLRIAKYELPGQFTLTRYIWYSYYIFQLGLPLLLARVAGLIDQARTGRPGSCWYLGLAFNLGLLLLIFTNDLHQLVFQLELDQGWDGSYSYGPAYYLIILSNICFLLLAVGLLLHKARQNPRRKALVVPLGLTVLLILYALLYVLRFPLAWESDFTITVGIFALLFLQSAMTGGLIPVNSKHTLLFRHSPLAIMIQDDRGQTVLASDKPAGNDGDRIRSAQITGGRVVWHEDLSAEKKLQESLTKTIQELAWSNEILSHEHHISSELARLELDVDLQDQLGAQLDLVNELYEQAAGGHLPVQLALARINLLLTYIKRRYNLSFWSRQSAKIGSSELVAYLAELGEMAASAGVVLALLPELEQELSLEMASACYSFLYDGLWQSIRKGQAELIARLSASEKALKLQLFADQPFSNEFSLVQTAQCCFQLHSEGYLHQAGLEISW